MLPSLRSGRSGYALLLSNWWGLGRWVCLSLLPWLSLLGVHVLRVCTSSRWGYRSTTPLCGSQRPLLLIGHISRICGLASSLAVLVHPQWRRAVQRWRVWAVLKLRVWAVLELQVPCLVHILCGHPCTRLLCHPIPTSGYLRLSWPSALSLIRL
jgi:hypothetical protein